MRSRRPCRRWLPRGMEAPPCRPSPTGQQPAKMRKGLFYKGFAGPVPTVFDALNHEQPSVVHERVRRVWRPLYDPAAKGVVLVLDDPGAVRPHLCQPTRRVVDVVELAERNQPTVRPSSPAAPKAADKPSNAIAEINSRFMIPLASIRI